MKKILYIILFVPLAMFGQEEDPCYSVNEFISETIELNQNISHDLIEGWSMFGFTCPESMDVLTAFEEIVGNVVIVKDHNGLVYLPEWGFNSIGNLQTGIGYQLKMLNPEIGFVFCNTSILFSIIEGCTDCEAFNFNALATTNDASCQYQGCMDSSADNYNPQAVIADYCQYLGCMDAMAGNYLPQANEDDGSCIVAEACPYDIYVEYSADAQSYNANLCQTLIVFGCTDYIAENYDSQANTEDNSCMYILGVLSH